MRASDPCVGIFGRVPCFSPTYLVESGRACLCRCEHLGCLCAGRNQHGCALGNIEVALQTIDFGCGDPTAGAARPSCWERSTNGNRDAGIDAARRDPGCCLVIRANRVSERASGSPRRAGGLGRRHPEDHTPQPKPGLHPVSLERITSHRDAAQSDRRSTGTSLYTCSPSECTRPNGSPPSSATSSRRSGSDATLA